MDKVMMVGDICNITTGKLDSNAFVDGGKYPFFTCAADPLRINTFAFDDDVVLIAGNNAQGNFHLNRFRGKFNAYQRTYVLTAKPYYDLDYIYYSLKLELKRLREKSQGSQTKFLTKPILNNIGIKYLDYSEQQKIAAVLSALDAKIELNHRIKAELESMAKTLYDYWLVQFDFPNEQGDHYKSSDGKMVWNEELKRKIPLGWEVKNLTDITKVSTDTINPMNFPEKEFKLYSIPAFDETGTFIIERGEKIMSNKFTVKNSDVLVSKLNPQFNRVVYATNDKDLICSSEFVVWRTENKSIKNYLYMIAKDAPFIDYCTRSASGTSHSHRRVNPQIMMRYLVPFYEDVVYKFGPVVNSAIEMLARNSVESQKLTELRDWLLPMLMNGQVTVRDMERDSKSNVLNSIDSLNAPISIKEIQI